MDIAKQADSDSCLLNDPNSHLPLIVLYSPDIDFCISLRLLLQDQYRIVTTTDATILLTIVNSFQPHLVILDGLPIEVVRRRFEKMKKENPHIRIMFFYASYFNNSWTQTLVREMVDAAFSKPLDLAEVVESIRGLVSQHD